VRRQPLQARRSRVVVGEETLCSPQGKDAAALRLRLRGDDPERVETAKREAVAQTARGNGATSRRLVLHGKVVPAPTNAMRKSLENPRELERLASIGKAVASAPIIGDVDGHETTAR